MTPTGPRRPGRLERMPAGPELIALMVVVLGVSLLPSTWWGAGTAVAVAVVAFAVAQLGDGLLGMRRLAGQVRAVRWLMLFTLVSQLVLLGPEPAVANTARVTSAIAIAGLLVLTTSMTELLGGIERGLGPLRRLGVDTERISLLLTVTAGTVPVLARLASEVREAQRARGARPGLRTFVVPFLVLSLKHADQLGDALTARGVR
ncbi:energy-coupling factor transporter transmembrane component T family protein [Clavibacter michiganensis]|uniref:Cobalt ABC transporter permease n=1 Tax=Clavibacter michiganensis subsp. insidiosus TaxID=33014 RepID=A0A0D5CH60_9MICO|nr:energy-coupling factor transporter transmembrane component T [Clavibacter michiganensis]AJW78956.1 cobalt ABC transporter permease [Clavibacter michiganensis subsp. insidiosus]AWF98361.1 cobalt ABC transporter permease [Clavibacter michiganensis subsp. insidiosus]AWG01438.1 cobalt ABC transporter permease [Clavibacter michiganensis subsp. insidiosus]OQJ60027.1 cobalt ABC transporter permease [Clavibacter michiganensis subsp. insidiosus]RII85382.1 energy-coupling factor transporter transmemb